MRSTLRPDTPSFGAALRASLRQDPDVILVGEMRDYETIVHLIAKTTTAINLATALAAVGENTQPASTTAISR